MKIKKGTKLTIKHLRKGVFNVIAKRDFDTKKDEFYPVKLDTNRVEGLNTYWERAEEIPCRRILCEIVEIRK